MTDLSRLSLPVRLLLLLAGTATVTGLSYLTGRFVVPLTDLLDRKMILAFNPDHYLPGFDQLFRAVSDHTMLLISVSIISWSIAYGLWRLFPRGRTALAVVLGVETLALAGFAIANRLIPNSTYTGVLLLLTLGVLACMGATTYAFYTLPPERMTAVTRLYGLILITVLLTNPLATDWLKKTIARPRPMNALNENWNTQLRPVPDELVRGANSFPSGHTSSTFALLTPVFWFVRDRRVRLGLMTWCVLQGMSRVYTVAHFPLCCLVGGVLGFTIGTMVFFLLGGPSLRRDAVPTPLRS